MRLTAAGGSSFRRQHAIRRLLDGHVVAALRAVVDVDASVAPVANEEISVLERRARTGGGVEAYRYFMGSATEVSLDKKNRMLIPKPLAQYAELEKDLLIVCTPAFIELWNPDLYEASLQQFAANDADAMNEIANQIFGGGDFYDSLS